MLTYYDHREARTRIKPRYIWGFWAFIVGLVTGMLILQLF